MEKDYSTIGFQHNGPQAYIILNRPEKGNALNLEMIRELKDCLSQIEQSPVIRIVILKGDGNNFCSGADLKWMAAAAEYNFERNLEESEELANLFRTIFTSQKLFIAKVHGACYGGGIGLAAACDFIVSSDSARYAFSEVRLGLVPATISPYIVFRLGKQRAKRLMLTGEQKSASQLELAGLVDLTICEEEIDSQIDKLIAALLQGGSEAQRNIKKLLNGFNSITSDETLYRKTAELIADSRVSDEGREGINAFLEKRKPKWK